MVDIIMSEPTKIFENDGVANLAKYIHVQGLRTFNTIIRQPKY